MRKLNEASRAMLTLHEEDPSDPEVAWDLAITQLQLGDYTKGFKGYEHRWRLQRNETKLRAGPHWAGEDITGQAHSGQAEQGFGDAIQFARYIPLLAERGAHIVLESLPELKTMFATLAGVEEVIDKGGAASKPIDLSVPLLSLARRSARRLRRFPRKTPYLQAPLAVTLPRRPGTFAVSVGLVWAGKPHTTRSFLAAAATRHAPGRPACCIF